LLFSGIVLGLKWGDCFVSFWPTIAYIYYVTLVFQVVAFGAFSVCGARRSLQEEWENQAATMLRRASGSSFSAAGRLRPATN
jgi:hypothetical protein